MSVGYGTITISDLEDKNFIWNLITGTMEPDISALPKIAGQTVDTATVGGVLTTAEHGIRVTNSGSKRTAIRFGDSTFSSGSMNGLVAGKTYTLSFDAAWNLFSISAETQNRYITAYLYTANASATDFTQIAHEHFGAITASDKGHDMTGRCEFTFTLADDVTKLYLWITGSRNNSGAAYYGDGDYIEVSNLKLEEGDHATEWSPHPDELKGTSITGVTNYYLASDSSSGVTTSTSGWTPTIQSISETKPYLWNYEKTYSGSTVISTTTPVIIGHYGVNGDTGRGISQITEHYQISDSASTAPTKWVDTPPVTTTAKPYLWNYETITYTSGTPATEDTSPRVIGTQGTSVTVSKTEYAEGDSGTTAPSTWQDTVPEVAMGKYLWTKITFSDGKYSYSVAKQAYEYVWNMLKETAKLLSSDFILSRSQVSGNTITLNYNYATSGTSYAKFRSDYLLYGDLKNKTFTWSFEAREIDGGDGLKSGQVLRTYCGVTPTSRIGYWYNESYDRYTNKNVALTSEWQSFQVQYTIPDNLMTGPDAALVDTNYVTLGFWRAAGYVACEIRNIKFEEGTLATGWTPHPDDLKGKSLTQVTEYYARNNSTTAPDDSAFNTIVISPTANEKYVWNYELMTWEDSGVTSTTTTDKHIIAVYGEKGNTGKALTGVTEYYAVNNSTTAPADADFSTTVAAPTAENKYLWNYELLTWDDNGTSSTSKTDKHIAAVYGDQGVPGVSATGLACRVNASNFTNTNNGECYYHGYNEANEKADVDGWVTFNGRQITIPKGDFINPNKSMPYNTVLYSVYRLDAATADTGTWHDVVYIESSNTWEANTYTGTSPGTSRSTWTWDDATDIILATYIMPESEGEVTDFQLFSPPKKYRELAEVATAGLRTFVDSVYSVAVQKIEDTIDGKIDTWFYAYAPSSTKAPESEWTTTALKESHLDDMFYDTSTGFCYRYTKTGSTYLWTRIKDSDITTAMSAASTAQDTADKKRRVFYTTPEPPYDKGDLWVQGESGDILRCEIPKTGSGAYDLSDWVLASKYTDDTVAVSSSHPNLTPMFSRTPYTAGDYWSTAPNKNYCTPLDDGWVHVYRDNSGGTATTNVNFTPVPDAKFDYGADYTFLLEFRNNRSIAGANNVGRFYIPESTNKQFYGITIKENLEGLRSDANVYCGESQAFCPGYEGVYIKRFIKTSEDEDSEYITGDLDGLCYFRFAVYAGAIFDIECRISIYEGRYLGAYKPYVDTTLRSEVYSIQESLISQIDGKIETWAKDSNPALEWTTASVRAQHDKDLWYYTGTSGLIIGSTNILPSCTYQYNGSSNTWSRYDEQSTSLFDFADGKSTIYYGTTSETYSGVKTGDYLVDSSTGSTYRWNGSSWDTMTDYQSAIDSVEIGGRNLWIVKDQVSGYIHASCTRVVADSSPNWPVCSDFIPVNGGDSLIIQEWIPNNTAEAEPHGYYAFYSSEDMSTPVGSRIEFYGEVGDEYLATITTVPSGANYVRVSVRGFGNSDVKTKIERGNKPTDWTPAPEDTESAIDAVLTAANGKNNNFYATTSNAPTGSTVGDTWFVFNEDGNVDDVKRWNGTGWVDAEYTSGIFKYIDAGKITAGTINTARLNVDEIISKGKLIVQGDNISDLNDDVGYATEEYVNSIEVGGRNLILDSGEFTNKSYLSKAYTLSDVGKDLTADDTVTFTFKAKLASDRTRWGIYSYSDKNTGVSGWQAITPDGETDVIYSWTGKWKLGGTANNVLRLYLGTNTTTSTENTVYWAKLERGNKATDYTPAPEDVDSAIDEVKKTANTANTSAANAQESANSAASEEQIIYISKASGTTSVSGTTTWITQTGDVQNTWTLKRPTYATDYPVLFVAKQTKTVAGVISCTTPLKDDTTTVIDGGHITTGTIDAAYLNIDDIIASGTIAVKSDLPTKVSELTNDSGYATTSAIPTKVSELTNDSSYVTSDDLDDVEAIASNANDKATAYRGTCTTAATTAAKVVTCTNFTLTTGVSITVYNSQKNTSSGALTLNVNSTGAITIYVAGAATSSSNQLLWTAGSSITYVYDGTYWRVNDYAGTLYGSTCTVSPGTAAKTTEVEECVIFKGVKVNVYMKYTNTSSSATLNVTSLGEKKIYCGDVSTVPTKSNARGWVASKIAEFQFNGQYWLLIENATYIDGGTITTGKIQSYDTKTYFDLNNSRIVAGNEAVIIDQNGIEFKGDETARIFSTAAHDDNADTMKLSYWNLEFGSPYLATHLWAYGLVVSEYLSKRTLSNGEWSASADPTFETTYAASITFDNVGYKTYGLRATIGFLGTSSKYIALSGQTEIDGTCPVFIADTCSTSTDTTQQIATDAFVWNAINTESGTGRVFGRTSGGSRKQYKIYSGTSTLSKGAYGSSNSYSQLVLNAPNLKTVFGLSAEPTMANCVVFFASNDIGDVVVGSKYGVLNGTYGWFATFSSAIAANTSLTINWLAIYFG